MCGAQNAAFRGTVGRNVANKMRASTPSCVAVTETKPCKVLVQEGFPGTKKTDVQIVKRVKKCSSLFRMQLIRLF